MYTSRPNLPVRTTKIALILTALLAALLFGGCGAQQQLASTQTELTQARDQLTAAQANATTLQGEVSARQTEVPQLKGQIATAEAQTQAEQAKNADLSKQLADAQAQVQAKETAIAGSQKQLADAQAQLATTQKELQDVKFSAERLVAQAEAALPKDDLDTAKRIAAELAEKHPGTKEVARAAEIVTQIEKSLADKAAAEKARLAAATGKMRVEKDDVRGIAFYQDKTTPKPILTTSFYAYIGQKDKRTWLRMYIQYHGDEWLFVRSFTIKAGDQNYEISPSYDEFKRDNGAYNVWEWYDGAVERKDVEMIKGIIADPKPVIRFHGENYYSDYTVTAAERKALQNVLDAFVALGGDLNNPNP